MKRKIKLSSEVLYFGYILILSFAVAMASSASLGLSMIVSPAYILSQKLTFLTFGQCEYVIQTILLVIFCIAMKKVKPIFLCSYATCLIYGAVLDLWRIVIPAFNPNVTPPGSQAFIVRVVYFVISIILTSLSIALCYHTYICAQVYDFFVKGITEHYHLNQTKFKSIFDFSFFVIGVVMTLVLFGKFVGIGWGTIVITIVNGPLIGFFGNILDKYFEITPSFPKFAKLFDL